MGYNELQGGPGEATDALWVIGAILLLLALMTLWPEIRGIVAPIVGLFRALIGA